jgi:integrase
VLRHSFANMANDLGFTEITIAALLGHASGRARAAMSIRSMRRSSWPPTRCRVTFRRCSTGR